jgi:hypothetical protein
VKIIHKIAAAPSFAAVLPVLDHKEIEERPSPVPSASKIMASAAVTKPPAITAGHETPEEWASLPIGVDDVLVRIPNSEFGEITCSIFPALFTC